MMVPMSRTPKGQKTLDHTALSLDIHLRSTIEDPVVRGSLKLTGALPVTKDLNDGDEITVTVNGPDGEQLAVPKHLRMPQVGIIGVERVHTATYQPDG